jgi:hypothetical protein
MLPVIYSSTPFMKKCLLVVLVASLSACASTQQERVGDIAATPLRDFNIKAPEIPPVLLEAKQKPYAAPVDQSCDGLGRQVAVLDEVLGADLDAESVTDELSKSARAKNAVGNAAAGALQKTVEGAIPFRGWVRKLSGAERHSNEASAAIAAGTARRAFLKGLALGKACQPLLASDPVITAR